MKLWKSLKISIGSRSDPKAYSQDLPQWGGQGYELDVFKSHTSLSTDSGLCTERGLRRTHIELLKPPGKRIGLKLAEHLDYDMDLPVDCTVTEANHDEVAVNKNDHVTRDHPDTCVPVETEDPLHPPSTDEVLDFDPVLVQALGDIEPDVTEFGDNIQTDLARQLGTILHSGLKKENKDELLKRYLIPKNLPLAKSPELNPEISGMLAEVCKLRDKRLLAKQTQLGKSLSALSKAVTGLLKKEPDVPDIIRTLNDCGKLLADSHYTETDTRRAIIFPLVDKSLAESFKERRRDHFLFGDNLGDLIKNSRGIKKTSQMIQALPSTSSSNLNGRGSSNRARHPRNTAAYPYRTGGPRPTTSYPIRRRGFQPPPPPPLLPPAPQRFIRRQVPLPPPRRPPGSALAHRHPSNRPA